MKKLNLLKSLFLLCALIVGSSSVWADPSKSTLTFTSACGGSGTADDGVKWTVTSDAAESTYDSERGVHYGTGSKSVSYIQLSTSDLTSGIITQIVVNASGNNTPTLSVTVGDEDFGTGQTLTTSNAAYTFNGTAAAGKIVVRIAKGSKSNGALYCKSIAVTYSTGAVVNVTGVSLDKTELTLTAGDSETLTPTVSPADATNKNVTWKSDDEDVATVEDGVVTAVAVGTCTITVKTVDGNKTATCAVTVKAAPEASVVWDFSETAWGFPDDYEKNESVYTNDGYSITIGGTASDGHKAMKSGSIQTGLIFGKNGAKITFPSFSFNVNKIIVYGLSGAASGVKFNFFVGEDAVSTEATGSHVDHTFKIAVDKQAAGTIYVLKLTTTDKNCQISKIEIFGYEETASVGADGWATYVTQNDVEFEEDEAFVVSAVGANATLAPATKVKKGTAVLLKGTGVKKPVVLADEPADVTNELKISDGTVTGASGDIYVLAKRSETVGFYLLGNATAIPAGKAYLKVAGAAHEFIGFDGETTGVVSVAKPQTTNTAEYYDLQGRRIAQPTKGLYIVNGKKVIIK